MDGYYQSANQITHSNKAEYIFFLFIIGILPFLYTSSLRDASDLPRYTILGIVPALILVSSLSKNKQLTNKFHIPVLLIISGLFITWTAISIHWSADPASSFIQTIQACSFFMLLLLSILLITSQARLFGIISVLTIATSIVSLIGLEQYFGNNLLNYRQSAAPAASFIHRNIAAQFITPIIPLFLLPIFLSAKKLWRWLAATGLGIALAYLFIIQTRGALLGLLVAALMALIMVLSMAPLRKTCFQRLRRSTIPLMSAAIIAMAISTIPPPSHNNTIKKIYNTVADTSSQIRLSSYRNSMDMVADKPLLGFGAGSFGMAFRNYMFSSQPVPQVSETNYLLVLHNDLLQTIVELGIPAGMLLLVGFIALLKMSRRVLISSQPENALIYLLILAGITALLIHSLFSFPLHRPTSAAVFTIMLGMLISMDTHKGIPFKTSFNPRIPAITTLILLALLNIAFYTDYLRNSFQLNLAWTHLSKALQTGGQSYEAHCKQAMLAARHTRFTSSAYARILMPQVYANCATDIREQYLFMSDVLEYEPDNAIAHLTRGRIFLRTGHPVRALSEFDKVIRILPERPTAYMGKADAYTALNNFDESTRLYRKVLELVPDSKQAKKALNRLKQHNK